MTKMIRNGLVVGAALVAFGIGAARAESDAKTVRLWKAKCASCHGEDGKGATEQGKKQGVGDMTAAAWQKDMTDAKIEGAIADGVKREKAGKKQEMDGYKEKLKPEQIKDLLGHIRSLAAK